ncbi:MAG: DUF937 domain-containing protein [Actinomycetia bacterium]|nr:DUF937 domain-containing protein [Actinomycetes bacterium]MCP4227237.1 DUF937 domain-containing protein [Actinomycetes bacterium]MCP5033408.1 DUF937 domain-containing protein [Actinomycetes bacterium]
MSALLDGIMGQLGSEGIGQISKSLGADEGVIGSAIEAALPAILGGMANNTQNQNGAESLSNALNDHDVSIFGQLGELLGSGGADGAKILGHVLGQRQPYVEKKVANSSGVNLELIMKLLPILAPLVMGYLSKEKKSKGLDSGSIGDVLRGEREQEEKRNPGLGGLASILDADGDGSILDDVLGKLLG